MRLLPWEYGIRNAGRSPLRFALTAGGSALVVGLALACGAFVRGMEKSLTTSAQSANVVLMGAGSEESVERSEIDPNVGSLLLATVPGIRTRLGVHYVSPEVHLQTSLRASRESEREFVVVLRGVTPQAFLVHPSVRIVEGRAPLAGRDEMMVGRLAAAKMGINDEELAIGSTLLFDNRTWTITGRFSAPNTVMDAEIWCPLRDLQIAAKRDNLSGVVATLDEAEFEDVDTFCKQRLDLELTAMRESEYYGKLAAFFQPVRTMVWTTAVLISLGGFLGWLNTMYAAFAMRVREFGTLQAIGYPRRAVVVSLLQESMLATACGGMLACVVAISLLDGLAVRFSMGAFGLVVDSSVVFVGLGAGLLLAIVGTLPPAWRCLRMPVSSALKAV